MASRASSSLLPSWFRCRPSAPSPEEARGTVTRRPLEDEHKRLIAALRPPRSGSPARLDLRQALAYETEKSRWIDEQKRLIAEAERRAGGPDPRWNENDHDGGKDDDRRKVKGNRAAVIEELSAFEIKKRRWMAEHKRSIARVRRLASIEEAWRLRKVHPAAVSTDTAGDQAKRPCVTYADRFGPGSDREFVKSLLNDEKSGGVVDGDSGRWLAERDDAHKRRQSYLRNYCPFQREEEEEEEEESVQEEEKKRTEPDDDAEIEQSVPVPPANGPGSVDGEFLMKSVIQKNPQLGGRRHSDEYYAMRGKALQSFKFVTDESAKASVGEARRSACATRRNYDCPFRTEEEAEEESVPENRKPEEPGDAEIERPALPADGPKSVLDAEFSMKSVNEKNLRGYRRGDEGYNAMRRQVLQSFKFGTDESEKVVGAARRSACATKRINVSFLRSVLGFARVPDASKTCCTG